MAEVPRNKGQFVQAGSVLIFDVAVSVGSMDGTVEFDTVYTQADYPELFARIGTAYNDAGKGDDAATQFRTQGAGGLPTLGAGYVYRLRF